MREVIQASYLQEQYLLQRFSTFSGFGCCYHVFEVLHW